jgi:hypothetical protein
MRHDCRKTHGGLIRALCAAMIAAAPLAAGTPVQAAPAVSALAKARSQFQQALALETAGDWGGALSLFQDVAAVKITPQVRFHIGLCQENLGKLVAANGEYQLAAAAADDSNATEVKAQVVARLDALRARIPKIVIKRGTGGDYATVSLDGVVLGAALIGKEMTVDPGPHTVEGRAPGFNLFMNSFNIGEKETKTIEVTLPRKSPGVATAGASPAPGGAAASGEMDEAPTDTTKRGKNYAPYIVGGIGVASLAASGIFFILRASAISDLDSECPSRSICSAHADDLYNQGKTYNTLASITLAAGLVGVSAGVVLFLVNKPTSTSGATAVQVAIEPSLGGAALRATF